MTIDEGPSVAIFRLRVSILPLTRCLREFWMVFVQKKRLSFFSHLLIMERSQNWPDLRSPISKFRDTRFIDTGTDINSTPGGGGCSNTPGPARVKCPPGIQVHQVLRGEECVLGQNACHILAPWPWNDLIITFQANRYSTLNTNSNLTSTSRPTSRTLKSSCC